MSIDVMIQLLLSHLLCGANALATTAVRRRVSTRVAGGGAGNERFLVALDTDAALL
jgi:hypothetical protein